MTLLRTGLTMLAQAGAKMVVNKVVNMVEQKSATSAPSMGVAPKQPLICGKLIGLSEKNAKRLAEKSGWKFRVASRDEEAFMLTADYREDRINAHVVGGKVTSVYIG